MIKYIIKRLLISVLVLFGVSIIIYTMVRLMPNNYVDINSIYGAGAYFPEQMEFSRSN